MTSVPIEEQLGLDISGALQGIGQIDDALTQVVQSFSVGLSSALETLVSVGSDVPSLAESLDVAGLGPAVDAALAEADTVVPIEADTTALSADIEGATDVAATIPVDADVAAAEEEIAGLSGETVTIEGDIDLGAAEEEIAALSGTAGDATASVGDLSSAAAGFGAVAAVAQGEVGGLNQGIQLLGPRAGAVGTAVAAAGAAVGGFFTQAVGAQAAVLRLDQAMGPLAVRIENLEIGNLSEDLSGLAVSLGSDDDALRNVAATFFNFQTGAGTAELEASKFSETVLALSARAVALNPALGSVEAVAGRLGNVLGRGGRFASQFNLDLSATDIKARAAKNATEGLGDGVSFAALQLAGGQIALEKYGDRLTEEIAEGTKNPIIQLRALGQEFEEAAEAIGAPLVAPIFEILEAIVPVAESVAEILGGLGEVTLPLLAGAAPLIAPLVDVLGFAADGLGAIADIIGAIPAPLLTLVEGLGALAFIIPPLVTSLRGMAIAGSLSLGPAGWVVLGVGALAALGAAAGLFGDNAEDAATDTTALSGAFEDSGSQAAGFASILDNLNASIAEYLKSALAAGDDGQTGLDTARALGVGYDQLADALSGTDESYQRFRNDLRASNEAQAIGTERSREFFDILEEGRGTIQDNARAALLSAVANGVLSEETLAAAEAANSAKGFNDDYGNAIVDNISVLRDLAPAIDKATQRTNEQADAAAEASPVYAQMVRDLASGAITTDTFTASLEQFGFVGTGAADKAKEISASIDALLSSVNSSLPTVGGAITDFASTVKQDMADVAAATEEGGLKLQSAFQKLVDDQNPQLFADNLNEQAAQIAGFAGSLATLIGEGFGELAAELAQAGPEAAGVLAAGLASDPSKAAIASSAAILRNQAVADINALVAEKIPELTGIGATAGSAVAKGIPQGFAAEQASLAAAISETGARLPLATILPTPTVPVPTPDTEGAKTAGEQTGQAAQDGFASKYQPAVAATTATQQVPPAIAVGMQPAIAAAGAGAIAVTATFKDHLHFGGVLTEHLGSLPGRIARAGAVSSEAAAAAGVSVGAAFGDGLADGIGTQLGDIEAAAAAAIRAAERAARREARSDSPSKVAMGIGQDWVAGLAEGLSNLSQVEAATAALTLALIPDLRPALRQTPQLASGIVQATPVLAGASPNPLAPDASAGTSKDVSVNVELHKVDVNPKLLADEIAYLVQ